VSLGGSPLITPQLLSIIGLVVIVSSLLAPIFIKRSFEEKGYTPAVAPKANAGLNGKSKGKYKSL
jgi:hypothetical protein